MTETGLSDSNGEPIMVGDLVKQPVTINKNLHGEWAVHEVIQRGLTPVLMYHHSEKGDVLPRHYTGAPLCDFYDGKMFCFASDLASLRPTDALEVLSKP